MLELKFVKEGPGIPQVRVYLHRPVEPLSGLGYFTLAPEQPVGKSRRELINSLTLEEDANPQELQLKGSTGVPILCSPRKETADF